MNLGSISSYLLIYIILWHGKKFGSNVYAETQSSASGSEDEDSKSEASSNAGKSARGGSVAHSKRGKSRSIDGDDLELLNLDVNVKRTTDEYKYTEEDGVHRFIAKGNRSFFAASKRGTTFWTAKDEKEYGKKIVIRKVNGESRFRVYFAADTPETEDEKAAKSEEEADHEPSTQNLIVLNVKNKESTDEYLYDYDEVDDVHTFTAVSPYMFGIVYKGKAVVWQTEDGRYPNVAMVLKDDQGEPFLRVFFPEAPVTPVAVEKPKKVVEEEEEVAEEVSEVSEVEEEEEAAPALSKKEMRRLLKERMPIQLNIRTKTTNSQYTFSKEGDIGTYTATDSFGFSSVVRNDERIWTQKDSTQLAVKVMFDGLGLTSSVRNVTVELIDGTFRHFERNQNTWSLRGNKLRLDVAKRATTLQYEYLEHHDVGTYTARFDYVFKEVFLGPYCCSAFCSDSQTEIWSGTADQGSKKVVIYLNLCTNRANFVSVHLTKSKINHYEKRGSYWTMTEPYIELDIDKKDSCYQFYYAGYDEIRSYCANYNFVFTRVYQGSTDIWRSEKQRYAKMVMMNGDGAMVPATKLAIVLKSGKKLYYNREGGGRWAKGDGFPPFELDLDDTFSTDYVEYEEDAEKQTSKYTTKHGFMIRSVVQDGIIWYTDSPKDYGVKVLTAEDKNVVTVYSASGKVRQFKRPDAGQPWSEVKPKLPEEEKKKKKKKGEVEEEDTKTSSKGLVLDLKRQESTDKYNFKRKGEMETYTAIGSNKFKTIQVGKSGSDLDKIFVAADSDEFVTKVVIDTSDDVGFINDVLLYLVDGTTKQFVKMSQKKKWREVVDV
ncbi:hypothetical protein MACJ_001795 [Theileria orientalis]|uniref:Uncharacterized protein n=1 Tax=Theileria orientalis TaxID=68886 RepID=A0A976QRU0_THEOR|nr:hypothetical protein MACJ_001795 [Theileria orientalis]